jgi:hypothetical protein
MLAAAITVTALSSVARGLADAALARARRAIRTADLVLWRAELELAARAAAPRPTRVDPSIPITYSGPEIHAWAARPQSVLHARLVLGRALARWTDTHRRAASAIQRPRSARCDRRVPASGMVRTSGLPLRGVSHPPADRSAEIGGGAASWP